MSGPGGAFQQKFNIMLDMKGSEITIYKNWKSPEMGSITVKGIKESQTQFEFPITTDIDNGDVLQIGSSRSLWKVVDIDEEINFGTATNLNVRVQKIDDFGNHIKFDTSGRAVFYGSVTGGVQIGGQANVQTVTITNTTNPDFAEALKGLLEVIKSSSVSDLDKEEYQSLIQRLDMLSLKEQTADVKELAKSKILSLENAFKAGDLLLKAAPFIATLTTYFS